MVKKGLIPNDFRDFLSVLSIIGFLAIFFEFALNNPFLSDNMTSLFLVIGGVGLMVAGKVFSIREWLRDGLQRNEVSLVLSVVMGVSAMVIGLLMLVGVALPINITGVVGFIALGPALFILLDYISKNT